MECNLKHRVLVRNTVYISRIVDLKKGTKVF